MRRTLVRIDTLLRGGFTQREVLREGRLEAAVHELSVAAVPLGVAYGLFMGLYAVMRGGPGRASSFSRPRSRCRCSSCSRCS